MRSQAIYTLPIEQADLMSANVEPLLKLLDPIASEPGRAKDHRNAMILDLSLYDPDPRPNWQIQAIRT